MGLHGKHTRVLLGGYNLSRFLNQTSEPISKEKAPCSGFSLNSHEYVMGLLDAQITLGGYGHFAADEVDDRLSAALADPDDAGVVYSRALDRFTIGTVVKLGLAKQSDYEISSTLSDAVQISGTAAVDGGIDTGKALHGLTNEAANGNASSVDNAASSANGGVGHLHVIAAAGTTLAVTIEHSTDNSVWAPLITFSGTSAVGAQRSTVSGTVNRYLRAAWTRASGNFTFAVAFARR